MSIDKKQIAEICRSLNTVIDKVQWVKTECEFNPQSQQALYLREALDELSNLRLQFSESKKPKINEDYLKVIELLADGQNPTEIAKDLGVVRQDIYRLVKTTVARITWYLDLMNQAGEVPDLQKDPSVGSVSGHPEQARHLLKLWRELNRAD